MRSQKYCSFVRYYMVLIILLLIIIFWGPCFCVSFSHPESAASLLVECYSNGLAQIPLLPTQGVEEEGGILQPAVAYSQYHYKLLSSTAILLSSLLPSGTAWHAAGVVRGTAVPLQVEREQKSFPCQPRSDQGENSWECGCCTLQLCSHRAPSSSVDTESIENLSNEGKQLYSVILRGCKSDLNNNNKKFLRQTYCVVSVSSNFSGLSI